MRVSRSCVLLGFARCGEDVSLIDQKAHLETCEQEVFCFFESGDGGFTRDGGKSLQKVFECFPAFQVVEQSLDGHTGSAKHRSSAKNFGVFDDDSHERIVSGSVGESAWYKITGLKTGHYKRKRPASEGGPYKIGPD